MRYAFVLSLRWPVIWTWLARNSLFCINCLRGQTSLIISLRKGLSLPPTSFTFILKIFLCFCDSPSPPTFFFLFLLPESTAVVVYVLPVEKYNHSAVCSCLLIKIKKNYNFIDRKNPSSQIFVLHRSSKSIQCNMHYIQGTCK